MSYVIGAGLLFVGVLTGYVICFASIKQTVKQTIEELINQGRAVVGADGKIEYLDE